MGLIVFDAMSTQRKTIDYIVENKDFYVVPVKKNQGILEDDIRIYFEDEVLLEKAKSIIIWRKVTWNLWKKRIYFYKWYRLVI